MKSNGKRSHEVDASECHGLKPKEIKRCKNTACMPLWYHDKWTEVSIYLYICISGFDGGYLHFCLQITVESLFSRAYNGCEYCKRKAFAIK